MQSLATELNLAETAFIEPCADGPYRLRWFTPTCEVDLCGHATLAAARAVWHAGITATPQLRFTTRSGELVARQMPKGIRISLPADMPQSLADDEIRQALGPNVTWLGLSRIGVIAVLKNEAAVRDFQPPLEHMAQWPGVLVAVTAAGATPRYDCVSRVFAPKVGIEEDPVTGAAHCALAPLWAERLSKSTLSAQQASARGGELTLEVDGERVHLTGNTHIIFQGECHA